MSGQQSSQYLTFKLSHQCCALPISEIREIIEYPNVDPLPLTPSYVIGATELRGSVVPIIDLAQRLNVATEPANQRTCVVVLDASSKTSELFGFKVDVVMQVVSISDDQIEQTPEFEGVASDIILSGLARTQKGLIAVVNPQALRSLVESSVMAVSQEHYHVR
ncbi:chemotaxis protein CheW [Vibrio sp. SCSIO 43136]|uniref:chemotaxis protein CheW n=1 Tax=Vibrio sp. SCSIO 43136 TaxID=2819101 RepID=UPI00207662B0|nr:chemotaxis protein CheW [Vibrio sp. SCSIO 43136]USD64253.1 purine-binding chemotaxis protein CheW [Vibrio sp. SCSIO 43136]